jgi:hypothetical protein
MIDWMFYRTMPVDDALLNCLSYYREGLNAAEAEIASQEVLSFFKVFEMRRDARKAKTWIKRVFADACANVHERTLEQFHSDRNELEIEDYCYNCRVAAGHASKKFKSDADKSSESRRLSVAAEVMRALARHYIRTKYHFSETYFSDGQRP